MTSHMNPYPPAPEDRRMSDGEILLRLEAMDQRYTSRLDQILEQTTKHNGRMEQIEKRQDMFDRWRAKLSGSFAVLLPALVIAQAVATALIIQWIGAR